MHEPSTRVSRRSVLALTAAGVGLAPTTAVATDDPAAAVDAESARTQALDQVLARFDVLGWTVPDEATDATLPPSDGEAVASDVAEALEGVEPGDVRSSDDPPAIEVLADVERDDVATAVEAAVGAPVSPSALRAHPTDATVASTAATLVERYEALEATASADVQADGRVEIRIDGVEPETVREVAATSSTELYAHYPGDDGAERTTLLTADGVEDVGPVDRTPGGMTVVPVTMDEDGAAAVAETLVDAGFTDEGVQACAGEADPGPDEYCLVTISDDEPVFVGGLAPALAEHLESGEFEANRQLQFSAPSLAEAQAIRSTLVTEPLPAPVAVASIDETSDDVADGDSNGDLDEGTPGVDEERSDVDDERSDDPMPGPGVLGALTALGMGAFLTRWTGLADREGRRSDRRE